MIKIGAVSYLNTKPLVHGMDEKLAHRDFQLSFDLPSRLATQLQAAELDVALIPSVETFLQQNLTIVSDACIACDGPVWSVKLLSRVPREEIRTLALDEGSRTSIQLVRILLAEQFNLFPECRPLPIESRWQDADVDAVLIIGDRAMNCRSDLFTHQWDLGQWWKDWTSLPFVFAVWAARPGVDLQHIESILCASRDRGIQNLESIATANAEKYGLSLTQCIDYLGSKLHFYLGPPEKTGLNMFYDHASAMSLVPRKRELVFHD
jgi:chorismate dehydratase